MLASIASTPSRPPPPPLAFSWLENEHLQSQIGADHFAGRREHSVSQLGAGN